jgi:hypothetical protein
MSTGDYDILGRVREEAGNLPTPPARYEGPRPTPPPQYQGPRPRRQGPKPIPVGSRSANAVQLPPGAEAAAEDRPPHAPLQEINERTRIINPLKRRREISDMEGSKRRSTTREERLQALDFEDNAREWQNKKGEMVLKRPSRRRVAALMGVNEAQGFFFVLPALLQVYFLLGAPSITVLSVWWFCGRALVLWSLSGCLAPQRLIFKLRRIQK